ncbi:hypothetical protein FRC07_010799 [Ceratobasidium sp. 392]|nr:hypothetical protein FRC07_010799 [Ceratobasidium sp. 392]
MSKRESSRVAKTQGKRARVIAVDDVFDDPEHDTDSKEQRSPPPKRQCTATKSAKTPVRKKQVKSKSTRVVGLADMPIKILTQIASNLEPIDVIFLARLNKHFRNLLMKRSSIDIWRGSMENVLGLPECPPDMSEPRYLALVFLKTCTSCGKAGKTEIDEVLRVRLCGSCRKTCLVVWNTVPAGIMALIPFSGKIAPNPRRSNAYSLRADVPGLVAEMEKVKKLNNKEAHQAWAAEKREIVQKRLQHAQLLREFFEIMELFREQEVEDAKADRKEEIERRLEEMGWIFEDMDFDYPGCTNKRAWLELVSEPKPLTDRGWPSLKSKLVTLLEGNRKQRLEVGLQARKKERQVRLSELFRIIKEKDCFTLEIPNPVPGNPNPDSASSISVPYAPPFPDFSHMLNYPVVLDLYETDCSVTEMDTKFEGYQKEIERYITEWTNRVQAHFTKLALEGPKIAKKTLLSTTIARDKKSNSLTKLPDDVKRLLRADSLFSTTSSFLMLGQNLTYGSMLKYHSLVGGYASTSTLSPQAPPHLEQITWDSEANKVARMLLTSMGKPNASYLEMTDKAIYTCGRCHNSEFKTWEQMIFHYLYQNKIYSRIQEELRSSTDLKVVYNNVHDPKVLSKQPLVQYTPTQATDDDDDDKLECKLCAMFLTVEGEAMPSEAKALKHLRDVHGITKPKVDEHYGPQITESDEYEAGLYDSDDGYFGGGYSGYGLYDGFSDEEGGGCAYARRLALVAGLITTRMIGIKVLWGAGLTPAAKSLPSLLFFPGVAYLIPKLATRALSANHTANALRIFLELPWHLRTISSLLLLVVGHALVGHQSRRRDRKRFGPDVVEAPKFKTWWPWNLGFVPFILDSMENGYSIEGWVGFLEDYGNTVNLNLLGGDLVVTSEPESLKCVLSTDFGSYEKGPAFRDKLFSVFGNGLFNTDGAVWKSHRNMIRPYFSKDRVAHFEIFARNSDKAINKLFARFEEPVREGLPVAVDFQNLVQHFVTKKEPY